MQTFTTTKFFCPEPGCGSFSEPQYDHEGEPYCPYCGCDFDERIKEREVPASWVSVAAYDVTRMYGGPEEGGWWYDAGEPIPGTVREFERCDFPQVATYIETLERRFSRVSVSVEERSSSFPKERPYYC